MAIVDDDLESEEGLRGAVYLSLFTDRRANDGDPLPAEDGDVRGCWQDEYLPDPDDRYGSKLWLLEREKVTPDLMSQADGYIRVALQWMLDDGVVEEIGVEMELVGG